METKDELQLMDQVIDRLTARNPELSRAEITQVVHEEHQKLEGRPVRAYVSVLVERSSRQRLQHHQALSAA